MTGYSSGIELGKSCRRYTRNVAGASGTSTRNPLYIHLNCPVQCAPVRKHFAPLRWPCLQRKRLLRWQPAVFPLVLPLGNACKIDLRECCAGYSGRISWASARKLSLSLYECPAPARQKAGYGPVAISRRHCRSSSPSRYLLRRRETWPKTSLCTYKRDGGMALHRDRACRRVGSERDGYDRPAGQNCYGELSRNEDVRLRARRASGAVGRGASPGEVPLRHPRA